MKKLERPAMVLLPKWPLANVEWFTPVWLRAEVPRVVPGDGCVPVCEPLSALLVIFICDPICDLCLVETAPPREGDELRVLPDRDGEGALVPEDAAGAPARAALAGLSCPEARVPASAWPAEPLAAVKECPWPSAAA